MKRIFFTCCILSACLTAAVAQNATQTQAQMKSEPPAKVTQLNTYLAANDANNATTTFSSVKQMMEQELGATKLEIAGASSDAERTAGLEKMHHQTTLYNQIMADIHSGITSNTTDLHTKLQDFINSY